MIGIFYGSTTGTTEQVAHWLQAIFMAKGVAEIELLDIAEYYLEEMMEFSLLILGIPTWDVGQLQKDWDRMLPEFDELDLAGKRVAIFGLGDQEGYPDTFVDGMFFLADKVQERGATVVGTWPVDGYTFEHSWAVVNGRFLGLVLDEHHQGELTPIRLEQWVDQLLIEFGLTGTQAP
jgi:flavodoxin I